jgi:GPI inositol-deacylase
MVPRITTNVRWATNLLFFVLAVYAAVFGMTYAYRLHHIANIVALWLVILHFSHIPGLTFCGIKDMFENDTEFDSTDVKKMP